KTNFVMVLIIVRVLPFFLTVSLVCSSTLFTSILGVRSYTDQRYSSMQISTTRHSSGVSTGRTVGFGSCVTGSDVDTDASRICVSGGGGAEATKGFSETGASAAGTAVSRGSGSGVAVLPTDLAEGSTTGSGSFSWAPTGAAAEAIALASSASMCSPAPAIKD